MQINHESSVITHEGGQTNESIRYVFISGGSAGSAAWGDITGTLNAQADLQSVLNAKAATPHVHVIADTGGLQGSLDGKAASVHTHDWAEVTGEPATFPPSTHSHATGDITDFAAVLSTKAAQSHVHDTSHITGGTIDTVRLGSGNANATTFLRGDSSWATPAGGGGGSVSLLRLPFHADASANVTLTNQAVAETFFANNTRNIIKAELADRTEVRLLSRVMTPSTSVNNPRLLVEWATAFTTTLTSFANIGTSPVQVSLAAAGFLDSGWGPLAPAAKGTGYVTVLQIGGNAADDPAVGPTYVDFR